MSVPDVSTKLEMLIKGHEAIQQTLQKLTDAVSKLALIEERQTADRKAVERVTDDLKKLDDRVRLLEKEVPNQLDRRLGDLEKKMPVHSMTSSAVIKVVGLVCMAVVGALLAVVVKGN